MAEFVEGKFSRFVQYNLPGAKVQAQQEPLGRGSYATVLELNYMGLKCAGKKIHEVLLSQGDTSYTVRRFEEECHLLSQVRHPNIVQFLGVHFQEGVPAPILVMEFLPINLTSCIEQYDILPKEISYSILHDVALGLCYLHNQTPPIIHRDLSSNNVLLASNMTAKISDLGVARIFNLTPLQVSRMTQTPGTPAYMPPEAMVADPKYDTNVDVFSYGIMMIHLFSGRWPEPQIGQNRVEGDQLTPVTEAERREVFLRAIRKDHPLMDLILKCIKNNPSQRANTCEIEQCVLEMKQQFPNLYVNQLEMLGKIKEQKDESKTLREEIEAMQRQIFVQSNDIEHLNIKIRNLETENESLQDTNKAICESMEDLALNDEKKNTDLKQIEEQREETLTFQRKRFDEELTNVRQHFEEQLSIEKIRVMTLTKENEKLLTKLANSQQTVDSLEDEKSKLNNIIAAKDDENRRKDATIKLKGGELKGSVKALREKDAIISDMTKQLATEREYLVNNKQVALAKLSWKKGLELPSTLSVKKMVVFGNKAYCGGGWQDSLFTTRMVFNVFCYNLVEENWTTLPPLPVRRFGLGQVSGKLVAVGGLKHESMPSNEVYVYNDLLDTWEQEIPPMPTARYGAVVISLQSALVVAGGYSTKVNKFLAFIRSAEFLETNAVEIFKSDTSQWYKADRLTGTCFHSTSGIAVGNTCYVLGNYVTEHYGGKHIGNITSYTTAVQCASVDDLLHNASTVPANQTTHSGSSDTQTAWKELPDRPATYPYSVSVAELAGNLVCIKDNNQVYMYISSSKSWINIGDIPKPDFSNNGLAAANLSPLEIIVFTKHVYKGTPVYV